MSETQKAIDQSDLLWQQGYEAGLAAAEARVDRQDKEIEWLRRIIDTLGGPPTTGTIRFSDILLAKEGEIELLRNDLEWMIKLHGWTPQAGGGLMSDIVEWLRRQAGLDERYDEAADEIERLRKALRCAGECHAGRWYASDHENYEFYVEQFIDRMMRGDHE